LVKDGYHADSIWEDLPRIEFLLAPNELDVLGGFIFKVGTGLEYSFVGITFDNTKAQGGSFSKPYVGIRVLLEIAVPVRPAAPRALPNISTMLAASPPK
jgi:hypothetical protein